MFLALALFFLTGCPPQIVRPPAQPIRYLTLAAKYNANVARVDQLWGRTDLALRWTDHGKKKTETGDGHLIMIPPDRLAMDVGKLGQTYLWAGCDDKRYWCFDLRDDGVLYVGAQDNIANHHWQDLPLPVRPLDVPRLLGLVYLPLAGDDALVQCVGADWVVDLPAQGLRLTIDPATFTARRVEILPADGAPAYTARLDTPQRVDQEHVAPEQSPVLPTHIIITLPGTRGQLQLDLHDLTDGRADERVQDRQFDLDKLRRIYKPGRTVDLDAP